ncbi:MAG: aminopeptidase P family protein [Velocimicrobium sp.]
MIKQRLNALREEMKKRNIDMYVIPTSDFHESEYVGEYFKARKYITGFTGSAGTAVVTMDEAGLWTDGRYFIQAANQLEGSGVSLYRMGEEGVPSVGEFIRKELKEGGCLGFDGRVINGKLGEDFESIVHKKNGKLFVEEDLIDRIWTDRPELSKEQGYVLDEKYAGKSAKEKLHEVRSIMRDRGASVHIITSLDDIAWLFNIRGNDIKSFPVILSYAVITIEESILFVNKEVLNDELIEHLDRNHIMVKEYHQIYEYIPTLSKEEVVLMDKTLVNFRICHSLQKEIQVIHAKNPSMLMKAIKNPIELSNTRNAHIKDGVAFTKFMYWLKNSIEKESITEISASDYLEERRREQDGFIELSFATISAYGANAAMMHYSATNETNTELKPEGFLLVDSGGHYFEGSTDITRTIALGMLTEKQKLHFTLVARSNLNLAAAKFLYGCSGLNLDILSRGPLWNLGIDYKCGTGHGIGYLLNVHEGPNGFRWKIVPERNDSAPLEEGMITTDEPGVYLEGEYGIRTENELICLKGEKNEYGQFMHFETITYAPIDLDAIIPEEMTRHEKKLLNEYHHLVYEKIAPYLTLEEAGWLKTYTREI